MIKVADEMVQMVYERIDFVNHGEHGIREGLAAVLAIAERQLQEAYGDAYQRGWHAGQYRLCPRCGIELDREVAAERDGAS